MVESHHYAVRQADAGRGEYALWSDGAERYSFLSLSLAVQIAADVMSTQITAALGRTFQLVHAGAVAMGGCGVLVPGDSFSGKSTTTALLSLAGYRHFGDDVAVLGDDLHLLPFPRAVKLRNGGWECVSHQFPVLAEQRLISGDSETDSWFLEGSEVDDASASAHDAQVRLVLFPTLDPDAPLVTEMTPFEVVPALLKQSFTAVHRFEKSVETIVSVVDSSTSYRLNMRRIPEAIEVVRDLVERHGSPSH